LLPRLRIAVRIDLLLVLAAVGMAVCSGIGLWSLRKQMLEDRRAQLQNVAELVIQHARGDLNEKGGPQSASGREAFFDMIRTTRYGPDSSGYFFVFDYNGVILSHPNPKFVGVNHLNVAQASARPFIEIAKSPAGYGFHEYLLPYTDDGKIRRKLAYIRNVPELDLLVCFGVFIEDIDTVFMSRLGEEAWLYAFVLPLIVLCGYAISRSITEPLSDILGQIKRLAKGDLGIPSAHAIDRSELGEVSAAMDILRANAIEQRALQQTVREQNGMLIEQMQMAQEAVRAKSEFLANMSHELRTPMHAILGYSDMSLTAFREGTPQSAGRFIENIKSSGKRLMRLLNDLLTLAKLDSGRIDYKREPADLKQVVDNTLIELAPLIRTKKLEVYSRFGANAEACFDGHYITQVLVNLLSNAIKFSDAGESIVIDVFEEQTVGGAASLCCRVSDSGPGIPNGELTTIFDKFVQSSKTNTGAGGTGLGLAICQKIIEDHGGRIWAEHAKPRGAVFTFVIPKEASACVEMPTAAVAA
jgi:signal transduction histidine kinase